MYIAFLLKYFRIIVNRIKPYGWICTSFLLLFQTVKEGPEDILEGAAHTEFNSRTWGRLSAPAGIGVLPVLLAPPARKLPAAGPEEGRVVAADIQVDPLHEAAVAADPLDLGTADEQATVHVQLAGGGHLPLDLGMAGSCLHTSLRPKNRYFIGNLRHWQQNCNNPKPGLLLSE